MVTLKTQHNLVALARIKVPVSNIGRLEVATLLKRTACVTLFTCKSTLKKPAGKEVEPRIVT